MKFNLKFIGGDNPKLKMRIHLVDQERALKVGRALVAFMNRKPSYGVAANQFGIMERVCAAKIQEPGRSGSTIRIFIDPQITHRSGSQTNIEGCLSWPGVTGKVKRPNELELKGNQNETVQTTKTGTKQDPGANQGRRIDTGIDRRINERFHQCCL